MKNLKLKRKSKRRKNIRKANTKATNIAKNKDNKLFKIKFNKNNEHTNSRDYRKIPKTAQETIPIERIYVDGIWQVGNRYSKTWAFSDINFQALDEEEKNNILLTYSAILKSLPDETQTKISLVNKKMSRERFAKESLLPLKSGTLGNEDKLGDYRAEYNQILLAKKQKGNNLTKERLLTVTLEKRTIDETRNFFTWLSNDLTSAFKKLSSNLHELSTNERLSLIHDFFRIDEEDNFRYDFAQKRIDGSSFKDSICPESIEFHSNYFEIADNKVGRVLFLREYPTAIGDDFLKKLSDLARNMVISLDLQPLSKEAALKKTDRVHLAVETDITRFRSRQNKNQNYLAEVPLELSRREENVSQVLSALAGGEQKMFLCTLTLVHVADTKTELDNDSESLKNIASGENADLACLTFQQEEGLNTCLPYGLKQIFAERSLLSNAVVGFVPFATKEIRHKNGIYYGTNATSGNLILCNRRELINANGFILGTSGSGKSFAAKLEQWGIFLSTDDEIFVVDPEAEYRQLAESLGGEVIKIAAGSNHHINAMDMEQGYGDTEGKRENPLILKTQFVMSLCEQVMDNAQITAQQKSLIARCVQNIYMDYMKNDYQGKTPTLKAFLRELKNQPEEQAQDIALAIELYADGTLDVFAHETNVDLHNRFTVFDLSELTNQMKAVGMLVMLDAIFNRVIANHKKGKRTWVYVDEIYLFFTNQYSATFLEESWKRFRKKGAAVTGITQNICDCLNYPEAQNMLSNSEFILMFNQAPRDIAIIQNLFQLSNDQVNAVRDAQKGAGLIKVGADIVPFVNDYPKESMFYKLANTNPEEKQRSNI